MPMFKGSMLLGKFHKKRMNSGVFFPFFMFYRSSESEIYKLLLRFDS